MISFSGAVDRATKRLARKLADAIVIVVDSAPTAMLAAHRYMAELLEGQDAMPINNRPELTMFAHKADTPDALRPDLVAAELLVESSITVVSTNRDQRGFLFGFALATSAAVKRVQRRDALGLKRTQHLTFPGFLAYLSDSQLDAAEVVAKPQAVDFPAPTTGAGGAGEALTSGGVRSSVVLTHDGPSPLGPTSPAGTQVMPSTVTAAAMQTEQATPLDHRVPSISPPLPRSVIRSDVDAVTTPTAQASVPLAFGAPESSAHPSTPQHPSSAGGGSGQRASALRRLISALRRAPDGVDSGLAGHKPSP